jgi:type III restriction enzyme
VIMNLDDLRAHREQEVAFLLAKLVLERYFKDNTFPQLLLLHGLANDAAGRIYHAIVRSTAGDKALKPILRPYDTVGTTRFVDFDTTRPTYATRPDKCHITHVVADTDSWEEKTAQALEDMDEVLAYIKNQNLGFTIPYTLDGDERQYIPDFLIRVARRDAEPVNLILEVSGERKRDKVAKAATARDLWVPAVNNHTAFGRWAYLEISDPWDAQNTIRAFVQQEASR